MFESTAVEKMNTTNSLRKMRWLWFIPIVLAVAFIPPAVSKPYQALKSLRFKHRVLIVDLERIDTKSSLMTFLESTAADIEERRILVLLVEERQVTSWPTIASPSQYSVAALKDLIQDHAVVLVGLDGSVKAQSNELDLETLFTTIDAMPMRRAEINQ